MPKRSPALDALFRALADPTRRAVAARLAEGPAPVSELARPFPMALPSFVQHPGVLEPAGLVVTGKRGRVRLCRLDPASLAAAEVWLAESRALWEAGFDRPDAFPSTPTGKDDLP